MMNLEDITQDILDNLYDRSKKPITSKKYFEGIDPILVSIAILALHDPIYKMTYTTYSVVEEQYQSMYDAAISVLYEAEYYTDTTYVDGLLESLDITKIGCTSLIDLLYILENTICKELYTDPVADVLAILYIKYLETSKHKKSGIILTPNNICELMTRCLNLDSTSKIIDMCSGTGSLILNATRYMKSRYDIETSVASAVEMNKNMKLLLDINMIYRNNNTDIYTGSCFDDCICEDILKNKPNRVILNPPYSTPIKELKFIEHSLDQLEIGGIGVFIVPYNTLYFLNKIDKAIRESIFSKHSLKAVCSASATIFEPSANIATCICIWEAYVPQYNNSTLSTEPTYMADWRQATADLVAEETMTDTAEKIIEDCMEKYKAATDIDNYSAVVYIEPNQEYIPEGYIHWVYTYPEQDYMDTIAAYKEYLIYAEELYEKSNHDI